MKPQAVFPGVMGTLGGDNNDTMCVCVCVHAHMKMSPPPHPVPSVRQDEAHPVPFQMTLLARGQPMVSGK